MIYITGDIHGNTSQIKYVMDKVNCKLDNVIIQLGDSGFNYYLNKKDKLIKDFVYNYDINWFVIRGNHDANPINNDNMMFVEQYGNYGFIEKDYPNIFYAENGRVYNIQGNIFLVLGGAYSVDKWYRLEVGYKWFVDEQMSEKERNNFFLFNDKLKVDTILSHTCPYENMPKHLFLSQIDQSTVDNSMEYFLQEVKEKIEYNNWFFGHFHANEEIEENMYMLYDGVIHYKPKGKLKIY